jgi:phospholipid/cholesterol/gamma-HCH transport system permease protein
MSTREITADLPRETALPRNALAPIDHIGRATLLLLAVARALLHPRRWVRATLHELHRQTFDTLPMALTLSVLGGALISQQTGYQFQGTLPSWIVGSIVAASLVTEVTPLFVGFSFIGIIGTRITAEIAAMQVTEQIDALEVMGRDPVQYLVVPRVVAGLLVGPLVTALCLVASMASGWFFALLTTRATSIDFWFGVRHYMRDFPLFYALIKGAAFSFAVTFISSYAGLEARGGSTGVGRTTRVAVIAMIAAVIVLTTALVPLLKLVRI